jgi:hypothetical protein
MIGFVMPEKNAIKVENIYPVKISVENARKNKSEYEPASNNNNKLINNYFRPVVKGDSNCCFT